RKLSLKWLSKPRIGRRSLNLVIGVAVDGGWLELGVIL
ncbi:hypothetical protein Csa_023707, partial [Cucumis sativus]